MHWSVFVDDEPRPSSIARRVVWVVIALCVLSGLTEVNAWPFTSWRLFSVSRTDVEVAWEIRREVSDDEVNMAALDRNLRDLEHIFREMGEDRVIVCDAVRSVLVDHDADTPISIQRVERQLTDHSVEFSRQVVVRC